MAETLWILGLSLSLVVQDFVHQQYDWGKLALNPGIWWIWPAETPLHGFPKFSSSDHVTTFFAIWLIFYQKMKFWLVVEPTHLKKYALFKMSSSSPRKVRDEHTKSSKPPPTSLPRTRRTLGTWPTSPTTLAQLRSAWVMFTLILRSLSCISIAFRPGKRQWWLETNKKYKDQIRNNINKIGFNESTTWNNQIHTFQNIQRHLTVQPKYPCWVLWLIPV